MHDAPLTLEKVSFGLDRGGAPTPRGFDRASVLGAVFLGSLLRLSYLGNKSLWFDEVLSIRTARLGIDQLVLGTAEGYHPPLYFVLLGRWLDLGDSALSIRTLSALFGILAIPVAYRWAMVLLGQRAAISTSWFTALGPLLIWYAQEARDYSLLLLVSLVSLLGIAHLITRPRFTWWAAFVIGTTAALYTHYGALLTISVQVLLAVVLAARSRTARGSWICMALGWLVVSLLYVPWLLTPAAQRFLGMVVSRDFYVDILTTGRPTLPEGLGFLLSVEPAQVALLATLSATAILVVGLAVISRVIRSRHLWFAGLRNVAPVRHLVAIGFVLLTIIAVLPRGYTLKRYTLIVWPLVFQCMAWFWPWDRINKRMLSVLLGFSLLASLVNVSMIPKAQWDQAAEFVLTAQQASDCVIVSPPYSALVFDYYARGQIPLHGLSPRSAHETLEQLSCKCSRLWVVSHTTDVGPERESLVTWLGERAQRTTISQFYRLRVELFEVGCRARDPSARDDC